MAEPDPETPAEDNTEAVDPETLIGAYCKGEVEGWAESRANEEDNDPEIPFLVGVPQFVEGPLDGYEVDVPEQNIKYFKFTITGYDVIPESIEEAEEPQVEPASR
jgi:hypothetical protein